MSKKTNIQKTVAWLELEQSGNTKEPLVLELEEYLEHKLSISRTKADKISISLHVLGADKVSRMMVSMLNL